MFLLAPLSWLYAAAMDVRNWMFNHGWLREQTFKIPTISIGNLAVGGTGKTPHTEWLVEHLLREGLHVATLSRGYGRKSKGYVEATASSSAADVGDEPLQMHLRFMENAIVAVCEDRCKGIRFLQERHPELDVIVLDDAFQHRYVRPAARVVLTDYARPFYADHVMPWGRLREKAKGAERADVIIVSKCPPTLSHSMQHAIISRLQPKRHQQVFFTAMQYAPLPITAIDGKIAVLAGIANPHPLVEHLRSGGFNIADELIYSDHHNFTDADLSRIENAASKATHIVTTAKDYARLRSLPLSSEARSKLIVQNISVYVLNNENHKLYELIKHAYANHH